jgi:5S rRNA maturation endonuclease (ribonuclease M5)
MPVVGSGNVIDFKMRFDDIDFSTALKELSEMAGISESPGLGRITETYYYCDEEGSLLYQVCRFEPKDFRPRRKGPDGSWIYDLQGVRRVPYNLPELVNASGAVIVEGEKDADNLKALGAGTTAVTTSQGGAKGWRPEYSDYFLSKQVAIIPDNDRPGLEYAETAARSLHGKASIIRVVELPGLGEKKEKHGPDVSDWIELRRKEGKADKDIKAELTKLIKEAPAWEPELEVGQPGLNSYSLGESEPVPLPDELSAVVAFDFDLLPESLRPWAEDISERIQCPPDFVGVGIMTGLAAVLGLKVAVRPQTRTDWTEIPNMWALVVGRPGVLKSPALDAVIAPLKRLAAEATKRHAVAVEEFKTAQVAAKLLRKKPAKYLRRTPTLTLRQFWQ